MISRTAIVASMRSDNAYRAIANGGMVSARAAIAVPAKTATGSASIIKAPPMRSRRTARRFRVGAGARGITRASSRRAAHSATRPVPTTISRSRGRRGPRCQFWHQNDEQQRGEKKRSKRSHGKYGKSRHQWFAFARAGAKASAKRQEAQRAAEQKIRDAVQNIHKSPRIGM